MAIRKGTLKKKWQKMKSSSRFHNVLSFLVFVAISILFWLIISLNDSVTQTFSVRLKFNNVPDSVTFITDPPVDMHVTLRDKGTNILRSGVAKHPTLNINFEDYAKDGLFRMTRSDMNAAFKREFVSGAQVSSLSIDSLRLPYTTSPGKRVPVIVSVDVSASSGNIIAGPPVALTKSVKIYSYGNEIDTVNRVYTTRLVKHDLSQTSVFDVKIRPIAGVKIVPPVVRVQLNVDPLVHKEGYATVVTEGVPEGQSLLLFPAKVPVSYYIPMSMFDEPDVPVEAIVRYDDTRATNGNRIPVTIGDYPAYVVSPEMHADSVEYTLVRH